MVSMCHVSTVHTEDDVRIFHKECLTLVQSGYKVSYVVPSGETRSMQGVSILAVPKPTSRVERMFLTSYRAVRTAKSTNASVYHFHDPEMLLWAPLLKRGRSKVIYDAHEDVPKQILTKEWLSPYTRKWVSRLAEHIENIISNRWLDAVIAATPPIARRFPPYKTVIVQNFPRRSEFAPVEFQSYSERPPLIVYIGGVTKIRGALEMREAIHMLPDALNARLVIAGSIDPPSLKEHLRDTTKITFRGWLSRDEIGKLLGTARIGLVLLHPTSNYMESQPIKLFEYMAAGIPVIASDFPLWREIVDGAQCGLLVDPLDPKAIAEAIEWLLTHPEEAEAMGQRGRKAVEERYNWESEARKLLALYETLREAREK